MTSMQQLSELLRRLRERTSLRLLRRLHRVTHRMTLLLRSVERARLLVVAPHMDDDVIGAGGTLLLHKRLGSDVTVVFCAAGATPDVDAVRRTEAHQAAAAMGFSRLEWLDLPDGSLSLHEPQMTTQLARLLRDQAPQQIFCPFVSDHHRDHAAVAQSVASAIRETGWEGEVWCFEVWSPLWPNVAVDISSVQTEKRRMIGIYVSQTAGLHYVDGILGLNSYRGLRVNVTHAEAFYACDAPRFCTLADQMNKL